MSVKTSGKGKGKLPREKRLKAKAKTNAGGDAVQLYDDFMFRTLSELRADLTKVDVKDVLERISGNYTGQDVTRELRNRDSEFCRVLLQACSEIGEVGRKYLGIFALTQPLLEPPTTAIAPSPATARPKKKRNKGKAKVGNEECNLIQLQPPAGSPTETIERLLSDTKDKDLLMSLADSIFKDLDLGDDPQKEMGMQDMFSLMSKVGGAVQQKVNSGDIDVAQLHKQAESFCQQISNNRDLQTIIDGNPVLAGLHNNIQRTESVSTDGATTTTTTTTANTSVGGMGDMLMGMFSQYSSMT